MKIPPISSTYQSQPPASDPIVQEFNQLWNNWFDHPTKQSAEALLAFMKKNHAHFEELAKHAPLPHPDVPFDEAYDAAIKTLQSWISHGCNPNATTAPSEFISDVAKWINYAGK